MTGVIRSVFPGQPPRHDKRPARAACGRRALVCRGGRGRILVRGSMNVPLTGTTRAEQREIDAAVAHVRARIRALDRSDQARNRTSAALPAYRGWSQNARIAYHPGEPGHRGLDPLPRRPLRRRWLDPKRARRRVVTIARRSRSERCSVVPVQGAEAGEVLRLYLKLGPITRPAPRHRVEMRSRNTVPSPRPRS